MYMWLKIDIAQLLIKMKFGSLWYKKKKPSKWYYRCDVCVKNVE